MLNEEQARDVYISSLELVNVINNYTSKENLSSKDIDEVQRNINILEKMLRDLSGSAQDLSLLTNAINNGKAITAAPVTFPQFAGDPSKSDINSPELSDFQALQYIASHGDLINAFGTNIEAGKSHYINFGKAEGRPLDNFDEWGYIASNNDLLTNFEGNTREAVENYISLGYSQGKLTNSFDPQSYLNNYTDLRNNFGDNWELATKHYVEYGFNEGRIF